MKSTSPNSTTHYSESSHTALCTRGGETFGPLGNTLEGGWRGWAVRGQDWNAGESARWGAEGTGMPQSDAEMKTKQLY